LTQLAATFIGSVVDRGAISSPENWPHFVGRAYTVEAGLYKEEPFAAPL
jgi:hypothetical protein